MTNLSDLITSGGVGGNPGRTFYSVTDGNTQIVSELDAVILAEAGSTITLPGSGGSASIEIVDPGFLDTDAWSVSTPVTVNATGGRLIGTGQDGETGDATLLIDNSSGPITLVNTDIDTSDWVVQFSVGPAGVDGSDAANPIVQQDVADLGQTIYVQFTGDPDPSSPVRGDIRIRQA